MSAATPLGYCESQGRFDISFSAVGYFDVFHLDIAKTGIRDQSSITTISLREPLLVKMLATSEFELPGYSRYDATGVRYLTHAALHKNPLFDRGSPRNARLEATANG